LRELGRIIFFTIFSGASSVYALLKWDIFNPKGVKAPL